MNDIIRFIAKEVVLEPRAGFIGFTDEGNEHYFWMQPGEMTTAKNEIWLERDDQAWGGYGDVWEVVVTRNKFTVVTNNLPYLACDAIEIEFAVGDATYDLLKSLLKKMMVDCQADLVIQ
jgi:hypothetical protein